jgi:glycosyltransferase involved in cell wall biosynthesis
VFDGHRIATVVPALDVASRIGRVISTLPSWVDRVIIVDDGSRDATSAVARATGRDGLEVCTHEFNRGVGAAIVTGYKRALAGDADVVVVMAGDGQMDPADLPALLAPVTLGDAHYAKGNRLRHRSVLRVMPAVRLVGNVALSALTRGATGLWHVGDSQCGYTAVRRPALEALDLDALWPRYGYPNDLLSALAVRGLTVVDVTVRPVYEGAPSGVRWRDALFTIPRILARAALRRHGVQPSR